MTQREFYTLILKGTGTSTETVDGKKVSTNVKLFGEDGALSAEVLDYATEQIEKLNEKNAGRKETKAEKEKRSANEALGQAILASFAVGETYTAGGLAEKFSTETAKVSSQKVTAVLKPLVKSGAIAVTENYKAKKGASPVKGYHLPTED